MEAGSGEEAWGEDDVGSEAGLSSRPLPPAAVISTAAVPLPARTLATESVWGDGDDGEADVIAGGHPAVHARRVLASSPLQPFPLRGVTSSSTAAHRLDVDATVTARDVVAQRADDLAALEAMGECLSVLWGREGRFRYSLSVRRHTSPLGHLSPNRHRAPLPSYPTDRCILCSPLPPPCRAARPLPPLHQLPLLPLADRVRQAAPAYALRGVAAAHSSSDSADSGGDDSISGIVAMQLIAARMGADLEVPWYDESDAGGDSASVGSDRTFPVDFDHDQALAALMRAADRHAASDGDVSRFAGSVATASTSFMRPTAASTARAEQTIGPVATVAMRLAASPLLDATLPSRGSAVHPRLRSASPAATRGVARNLLGEIDAVRTGGAGGAGGGAGGSKVVHRTTIVGGRAVSRKMVQVREMGEGEMSTNRHPPYPPPCAGVASPIPSWRWRVHGSLPATRAAPRSRGGPHSRLCSLSGRDSRAVTGVRVARRWPAARAQHGTAAAWRGDSCW